MAKPTFDEIRDGAIHPDHIPEIVAISLKDLQVFLSDDTTRPIVSLIDEDGDETHDPAEAVRFVVMLSARQFYAAAIGDFRKLVRH